MNFLTGAPADNHGARTIGIRPEHLDVVTSRGDIAGIVDFTEILGSESFLYVKTDHGLLTVHEDGKTNFKNGDAVHLVPKTGMIHRFDDTGKRLQ
jgi:multiple sugar transport system ATP-binding protein